LNNKSAPLTGRAAMSAPAAVSINNKMKKNKKLQNMKKTILKAGRVGLCP
jgi:hypothetical protein